MHLYKHCDIKEVYNRCIYNRIIYLSLSLLHLNMMARYEIQCIINNKIYRKIHYFHYYNYTCHKGESTRMPTP